MLLSRVSDSRPLLVLLAAAAILGVGPILVRMAEVGPAASAFWRIFLALPVLLAFSLRPGGEGPGLPSRWMLLAGAFFFLDLTFWHYGIAMTSVANASLLCALAPVAVALFSWIVLKERPTRLFVLALALALGGAGAMSAGSDGGQGSSPLLGDLLSLMVAGWYAGYFLALKKALANAGAVRAIFWSSAASAPLMLGAAFLMGEDILPATLVGWSACMGLGLAHVLGQGGVAWALGRTPATIAALVLMVQPLATAVLGWLILGETMSLTQMAGGALVLGGVLLAHRSTGAAPVAATQAISRARKRRRARNPENSAPAVVSDPEPSGRQD